jgi:Tfp pilus assembly protein PilO
MEKSAQWMTLQELRDELDRTRPAWDELAHLDDVPKDGELPALSEDARRHELVLSELLRRPNNG